MTRLYCIIFSLLFFSIGYSQKNQKTDSLLQLLHHAKADTMQARFNFEIGREFQNVAPDTAIYFFNKTISISKKLSDNIYLQILMAQSLQSIGLIFCNSKGQYDTTLQITQSAMNIFYNLKKQKSENSKIEIQIKKGIASCFNSYGVVYWYQGLYDKAITNFLKSLKLNEEIKDTKGMASCYNNIGSILDNQGYYTNALEYYFKSLKMKEKLNDNKGIAACYNNIGIVYRNLKDYEKSMEYFQKSLRIYEELNDKKRIADSFNNIGIVYGNQNILKQALDYFFKSLKIREEIRDKNGVANVSGNIAELSLRFADSVKNDKFLKAKYLQQTIDYADKAIQIAYSIRAQQLVNVAAGYLQKAYKLSGNPTRALEFAEIFQSTKDSLLNKEKAKIITEMENKYQNEKNQKEIELLEKDKSLKSEVIQKQKIIIFSVIGGLIFLFGFSIILFRLFVQKKKAYKLLTEKNIEIEQQKEEILSQSEQLAEINKELEKLSIVASETDNAVVIADKHGELTWFNNSFTKLYGYTKEEFIKQKGSNIFVTSSNLNINTFVSECVQSKSSVVYTSVNTTKSGDKIHVQTTLTPVLDEMMNVIKLVAIDSDITKLKEAEEEIKIQKEEIESQRDELQLHRDQLTVSNKQLSLKNTQIIDSINYAHLIQEALLPNENLIKKIFPDSFIFFKPRDIVSGDFYWLHSEGNKVFYAIADCTGHGVPGAFMSMIGTTLLNEIVKNKKIHTPSQILHKLNREVMYSLKQYDDDTKSQGDGMDISIISYDFQLKKLTVSLANHTMLIKKNNEIEVLNGDIYSIGGVFGSLKNVRYDDVEIPVTSGDTSIYLFTDGIKDQFSVEHKKFGLERLRKVFIACMDLPMEQQKTQLEQAFDTWKGTHFQLDDVLVAGIRF